MPEQASLFGSGGQLDTLDSPLEGHSLWNLASITPGSARICLFYFILFCSSYLFYFSCRNAPALEVLAGGRARRVHLLDPELAVHASYLQTGEAVHDVA